MIFLFTDFGASGPYVGQMRAVLAANAPGVPAVELLSDAPAFDPRAAGHLLAALAEGVLAAVRAPGPPGPAARPPTAAEGAVFRPVLLCVVDPGVGTERRPLAVLADGAWYVGPDNGLFEPVLRRAARAEAWEIAWRPAALSASFHGRDLFAPVAASLALGNPPPGAPVEPLRRPDWPDEAAEVIYVDPYGNAMTGLRAALLPADAVLEAGGRRLARARTFGDVPPGEAFWYANSCGLAEVAVNRGRADQVLGLEVGTPVRVA